jgi:AcrR family transcriptional regulator
MLKLSCEPSRRDRKRAETRDRILEAALGLIGERGFDNVTVEMITERADVAKGTFFNYFAGKEAVIEDFFQSQMERATEAITLSTEPGLEMRIWDFIVKVVHVVAESDTRTKNLTRALLALALTNEEVRAACHRVTERGCEEGRHLIQQAQQAGELRNDISADELSRHIMSGYFGVLRDWACDLTKSDDVHQELDKRMKLIYEGLRP